MIKIRNFILTVLILFGISFIITFLYIAMYPAKTDMIGSKYLCVVFGAGITRASAPSPALKSRLDKALELYNSQKVLKILVSGKEPEAVVMRIYLYKNGIIPEDIISDTNGRNTSVTMENVKNFIDSNHVQNGVVFVSQRYHLPRIILLSSHMNVKRALYVAADWKKIDRDEQFFFIVRESMAVLKTLVIGE